MGQVRLNLDRFNECRGQKTLAVFADELGVDKGTVSRVVNGKALPGNHFIAAVLINLPFAFNHFFEVEG